MLLLTKFEISVELELDINFVGLDELKTEDNMLILLVDLLDFWVEKDI